jgi:hypothetical protein
MKALKIFISESARAIKLSYFASSNETPKQMFKL